MLKKIKCVFKGHFIDCVSILISCPFILYFYNFMGIFCNTSFKLLLVIFCEKWYNGVYIALNKLK